VTFVRKAYILKLLKIQIFHVPTPVPVIKSYEKTIVDERWLEMYKPHPPCHSLPRPPPPCSSAGPHAASSTGGCRCPTPQSNMNYRKAESGSQGRVFINIPSFLLYDLSNSEFLLFGHPVLLGYDNICQILDVGVELYGDVPGGPGLQYGPVVLHIVLDTVVDVWNLNKKTL
jgi:hypothetical protein